MRELTYLDWRGERHVLDLDSVLYFQSGQKYVTAHTKTGEILTDYTLICLEAELSDFIRVHRAYLVRRSLILVMYRRWAERDSWLTVKGVDKAIPVSRRRIPALRDFIESKEKQA